MTEALGKEKESLFLATLYKHFFTYHSFIVDIHFITVYIQCFTIRYTFIVQAIFTNMTVHAHYPPHADHAFHALYFTKSPFLKLYL